MGKYFERRESEHFWVESEDFDRPGVGVGKLYRPGVGVEKFDRPGVGVEKFDRPGVGVGSFTSTTLKLCSNI